MDYGKVRLTHEELLFAGQAGSLRRTSAIKAKRHQRWGNTGKNSKGQDILWDQDIEGCAAEMLVAKATNKYWLPFSNDPRSIKSDVGTNIQVRHTSRINGCLLIHPDDPDDQLFFLVTGSNVEMTIKGYIKGVDAKKPEYWKESTGRPCYFVPQTALIKK